MLRGRFGAIGKDFRDGHIVMDAFQQVGMESCHAGAARMYLDPRKKAIGVVTRLTPCTPCTYIELNHVCLASGTPCNYRIEPPRHYCVGCFIWLDAVLLY